MRKTLVLLLLLGILSLPVAAAYGSEGIEASLEGPAAEIMKGLAPGNLEPDSFLERLWAYISSAVKSELKAVLRPVAAVAAAAVLCSLGEGLQLKNEINYVKEFLGHENIATTQIYTNLKEKDVVERFKEIDII